MIARLLGKLVIRAAAMLLAAAEAERRRELQERAAAAAACAHCARDVENELLRARLADALSEMYDVVPDVWISFEAHLPRLGLNPPSVVRTAFRWRVATREGAIVFAGADVETPLRAALRYFDPRARDVVVDALELHMSGRFS